MKLSFFKYLLIFSIVAVAIYSCVKKTTYPTVPIIEYRNFIAFDGDSADLQIRFTDGDGDIGVSESDSTKTFWYTYYYQDTVSLNYVGYYRPLFNDTLRVGYMIKSPSDAYKGKPISGEVSVRLQKYRHSKRIKHVKYVVYLLDAAGNKSNVVTTPAITVP
jgi:hypothetical protein